MSDSFVLIEEQQEGAQVVIDHEQEIADFLATRGLSYHKHNSLRAYLVEFVKFQASRKVEPKC